MRREQGAIFPLAVFLIVVAVAFLALTIDVMRSAYTVGQLRFAAQSAALAAYSRQVVTPEEFYNGALARQHIIDALAKINGDLGEAPWHKASKVPIALARVSVLLGLMQTKWSFLSICKMTRNFLSGLK
ncbi:MAG: hypothetical protein IPP97_14395 [Candidatus Obscuribacter sp.]|nr:hypothetical protein [Candidatus Obscuribacter sp.]